MSGYHRLKLSKKRSFIVHSMLPKKKKCNQLLHELDMSENARNNIKLDSIPYFYL